MAGTFLRAALTVSLMAIAAEAHVFAADGCLWFCKPLYAEICGRCPDNYCPKPQPAIGCICPPFGCDDYCRKPQPCVPCLPPSCGMDCYDCKPLPPCPPCCEPWYQCGGSRPAATMSVLPQW